MSKDCVELNHLLLLLCGFVLLIPNPTNGKYFGPGDEDRLRDDLQNACSFESQLEIIYGDLVYCDDTMKIHKVNKRPIVKYADRNYSLFMFTGDHDESNGDILRPYMEWAVTGIKGSDIREGKIAWNTGLDYLPPKYTQDKQKMKYELTISEETSPVPDTIFAGEYIRRRFPFWGVIQGYGLYNVKSMTEFYVDK